MNMYIDLINNFKGIECTFIEMESAFSEKTGDDVLNNISVNRILENKSISFKLGTDDNFEEYLNVQFEIIKQTENPLDTLIKIYNVEII